MEKATQVNQISNPIVPTLRKKEADLVMKSLHEVEDREQKLDQLAVIIAMINHVPKIQRNTATSHFVASRGMVTITILTKPNVAKNLYTAGDFQY